LGADKRFDWFNRLRFILCYLVSDKTKEANYVEMRGIDPRTSRMLSERSTI